MNRFSAWIRCLRPRSIITHSAASMTRGTMSKGQTFSVPASWPYTLKVIPIVKSALSAAFCRSASSPWEKAASRRTNCSAPGRGRKSTSNSSSQKPSVWYDWRSMAASVPEDGTAGDWAPRGGPLKGSGSRARRRQGGRKATGSHAARTPPITFARYTIPRREGMGPDSLSLKPALTPA